MSAFHPTATEQRTQFYVGFVPCVDGSELSGTQMPQGGHPPHHSITSSAIASTLGGIASPSALAVLRLSTNWNFVG